MSDLTKGDRNTQQSIHPQQVEFPTTSLLTLETDFIDGMYISHQYLS